MTAILPTAAEVAERYVPLRVENGRVADGPFAGATATRDMRWTCLGLRCVELDGYRLHEPRCDRDDALPPPPLPNPKPWEQRLIDAAEAGDLWVEHGSYSGGYDGELARRQENTRRGGES